MKKLLLIILTIFLSMVNAQDKKYLLFQNWNPEFRVYSFQKELTYKVEKYKAGKEIELIETKIETYKNQEEEHDFLKGLLPLSSIKTDDVKEFDKYRNRSFKVIDKRDNTTDSYCFYGSFFLTDNVRRGRSYSDQLILPELCEGVANKRNEEKENSEKKYYLQKIEGITFLVIERRIFLFDAKNLFKTIFGENEVVFTGTNFANFFNSKALEISQVSVGNKIMYGVNDDTNRVVLPMEFEKIIISGDAILAKENGLWYFYDFYGNKLMEKGYRKILPATFNPKFTKHRPTYDGLIVYSVLEGNKIKTVEDIYKKSKTSKFYNNLGELEFCGTTMGMSRSEKINFEFDEKEFTLNQTISYTGISSYHPPLGSDWIRKENKYSFQNPFEGVSYINKGDKEFLFQKSSESKPMVVVLKRKNKENKWTPFFVTISEENKELPFYLVNYYDLGRSESNPNSSYDEILDLKADLPLLNLKGDYACTYNFSNSNFVSDSYYKVRNGDKLGLYSPRSTFLKDVKIKYTKLDDLTMRFSRFEDETGKAGWLSEDGEEFYDL
ncbi:hypothetical protein [Chryseobacterium sp. JK1]|uniref:hypothetical protein n=1 Tax=Chryseobacterium sp. JK1 TaxID=874294 RepID=UPI003D691DA0